MKSTTPLSQRKISYQLPDCGFCGIRASIFIFYPIVCCYLIRQVPYKFRYCSQGSRRSPGAIPGQASQVSRDLPRVLVTASYLWPQCRGRVRGKPGRQNQKPGDKARSRKPEAGEDERRVEGQPACRGDGLPTGDHWTPQPLDLLSSSIESVTQCPVTEQARGDHDEVHAISDVARDKVISRTRRKSNDNRDSKPAARTRSWG
jgi:hypothetical protein